MSYRLINANTIAESYPEVNDMPCIYADIDGGLDGQHYDLRGASTLQAENAKLREELAKWERLAAGIDLPEYPVTQFKPKDLERENAKLRKAVDYLYGFAKTCGVSADDLRELGIEVTS